MWSDLGERVPSELENNACFTVVSSPHLALPLVDPGLLLFALFLTKSSPFFLKVLS